jgi:Glutamine synthetase
LNAFFENESKGFELTETALSYIAGLLIHSPSLLAITNPSTNSYKRLFSGFEAPNRAFFSFSNRKASIRIPVYVKDPLEKRIEFRPPDATGNVYLSMSAMLLAGIDGIENSLNLKAKNLDSEDSAIMLPKNLEEALTKSLK